DGSRVGDGAATSQLGEIVTQTGIFPSPLRELESVLSAIVVPLQNCLDNPPGDSVSVVVQVGPDGALTQDPELLNSSGYEVLDEKALEISREADYGSYHSSGETKAYSFAIKVDYDACNMAFNQSPNVQPG
ncbi:MAG: hypothetical protein F6K11_37740, partial [Leptolyngbya sp. SIO3F4]|nr:hypothetical protein [Leptolyngbya sp. SIO3F4]